MNCTIGNTDRRILALPVRLGGLGIDNPGLEPEDSYQYSKRITGPLSQYIMVQRHQQLEEAKTT